jgi:hypothetical protein
MKCSCGKSIAFESCYIVDNDNEAICESCHREREKEKHQVPDNLKDVIENERWRDMRKKGEV